ncbi:hypothetical protein [Corynebacterium propinquum]
MSQNKNSPLQREENKTVLDGEEQSSRASSWWILALIALFAVTTILDKRKPHPFTTPTELHHKQTKGGQIESSASDNGQVRDKWNPQTLGNFSLVLIQGALFSLFQIIGPSGSWEDKEWGVGSCLLIALVGLVVFFLATKMSPSGSVIVVMSLLFLTVFAAYSSWKGLSTVWVIIFQISSLAVAWWASESLKGPSQKWLE